MTGTIRRQNLGGSDMRVSELGLGCMGLSEFYGQPVAQNVATRLIHHALDQGVNFFDTADMYGGGHNETLVGTALRGRRDQAVVATKFGIVRQGREYARTVCGRPEYVRTACHDSLRRLGTEHIDLYYIHRVDRDTPIEDTVGEMARLVDEGKVRALGISEPAAATLRRAHAVHPMAAVQSEYSMLTRDPEVEMLALTRELGITFVPYSPICRGLLSAATVRTDDPAEVRTALPRFQGEAYSGNKRIAVKLAGIAADLGCSLAQLCLAWVMVRGEGIVPIPGTTKIENLDANLGAARISLSPEVLGRISAVLDSHVVQGERYTAEGMKGVNL